MKWIFPDDRMRERRLPPFFASALRSTGLHSDGTEVVVAGAQVLGCAIWMAPGTWRPPLRRQLAALPSVVIRLRSRLAVASMTYGALQRVHPDRPHWYFVRDRSRSARPGHRRRQRADALPAGSLRRGLGTGVPRVQRREERAVLPAPRLPG